MAKIDESQTPLSLDRLKALSDGVFAIVITILVLELDVPESHDFTESGILAFLAKNRASIIALYREFRINRWLLGLAPPDVEIPLTLRSQLFVAKPVVHVTPDTGPVC